MLFFASGLCLICQLVVSWGNPFGFLHITWVSIRSLRLPCPFETQCCSSAGTSRGGEGGGNR
eukprot:3698186-Amphidinium_carterae.1